MDKSINRAKEIMAEDDAETRIQELDTRIKKLDGKPAKKPKKKGRKTAGESFDSSITKSIQRLYPKRGRY